MNILACGISLLVLNGWTPKKDLDPKASPICFEATQDKNEASLIVMKTSGAKQSCSEFLREMDLSRHKKNILSNEQQAAKPDFLKSAQATEGARGEYEINDKTVRIPVKQRSFCFKKGEEIRVLTATYQKEKGAQWEPLLESIFASFSFQLKP